MLYLLFFYIVLLIGTLFDFNLFFFNEECLIFISLSTFFLILISSFRKATVLFFFSEIKSIYLYFLFLFSVIFQ